MTEFTQEEKDSIELEFNEILKCCPKCRKDPESVATIRKAFDLANEAHYGMRRRSGEPYIFHPIEVAKIASGEIGLGMKSVVCALLHDVVEDTDVTLEDIEHLFDPKIAQIVDGLTKIRGLLKTKSSQAENIKKVLLTLSEDLRVILIKISDRLHNMRTMDSMPLDKQLRITAETRSLFVPLAHRLGFYSIKMELEDLCLKYERPVIYNEIYNKLKGSEKKRIHYLNRFSIPIMMTLEQNDINYHISSRSKSISSIWEKIKKKNVTFENIYDVFAIRIILVDVPREEEKAMCWRVYSFITDTYTPNPKRLRDWISTPRDNGYEALHTTVMGPDGNWVEIQIRTQRMDEIAEHGYAAHWKYKDIDGFEKTELEVWLSKIRVTLANPSNDALAFLDDFKLNLYATEIFVFTPKGELKRLPTKSTVLDFAYEIHTEVGNHAIGAKINRSKTVPLNYELQSGDQIEILTSEKQTPKKEWFTFVSTSKAIKELQHIFKNEKKRITRIGQKMLEKKLEQLEIKETESLYEKLLIVFNLLKLEDLYEGIGNGTIDISDLKKKIEFKRRSKVVQFWNLQLRRKKTEKKETSDDLYVIKNHTNYKVAECCKPIPGDAVLGFKENDYFVIHTRNCPIAIELQDTQEPYKINWVSKKEQAFLVSIKIEANDRIGLLNEITKIISTQSNISIRTIHFDNADKYTEGSLDLYTNDLKYLNNLMVKLQKIKGVTKVYRTETK